MIREEKVRKITRGGRNLILLGVLSVLIAGATTGVSLAIYHNSGDIYPDRSRPGFLPDQDEIEQDEENEPDVIYDYATEGDVTVEGLTEYLEKLDSEIKLIDAYEKPFDMEILSDEHFGIPTE